MNILFFQREQVDAVATRRNGLCSESDVHDCACVVTRSKLQRNAPSHPTRIQDPPNQTTEHEEGECVLQPEAVS